MALVAGVGVVAAIGAAGLGLYMNAAPPCDGTRTLGRVYDIMRDEFHQPSIFLNDVSTVSGEWFSESRDCVADVTPIRGNENASALPWHEIHYHIAHPDESQPLAVTVELGGDVPLAPPQLSLWARLLAYL